MAKKPATDMQADAKKNPKAHAKAKAVVEKMDPADLAALLFGKPPKKKR